MSSRRRYFLTWQIFIHTAGLIVQIFKCIHVCTCVHTIHVLHFPPDGIWELVTHLPTEWQGLSGGGRWRVSPSQLCRRWPTISGCERHTTKNTMQHCRMAKSFFEQAHNTYFTPQLHNWRHMTACTRMHTHSNSSICWINEEHEYKTTQSSQSSYNEKYNYGCDKNSEQRTGNTRSLHV